MSPCVAPDAIAGTCSYCGYLAWCEPLSRSLIDGRRGRFAVCADCIGDWQRTGRNELAAGSETPAIPHASDVPERIGPGRETQRELFQRRWWAK